MWNYWVNFGIYRKRYMVVFEKVYLFFLLRNFCFRVLGFYIRILGVIKMFFFFEERKNIGNIINKSVGRIFLKWKRKELDFII